MHTSIRGIDESVFREFKSEASKKGLAIGEAINMAMEHWIDKEAEKKDILAFKPASWGKGTETTSEDIDKILYGG